MNTSHDKENNPENSYSRADFQAALAMAGGDVELLRELVGAYLNEVPRLLNALRVAVEQRNAESLRNGAHQLQGVMRCLHIERVLQQARQLELLGEGPPDWQAAASQLDALSGASDLSIQALKRYLGEQV